MDPPLVQWDVESLSQLQETIQFVVMGPWNFKAVDKMITKHILVSGSWALLKGCLLQARLA